MSENVHKCTSCRETQESIQRMEKRLIRIEYLLRKQITPEVCHKVRQDSFILPQTLDEFDEHEEKLDDEQYSNWLKQFLINVNDNGTVPLRSFLPDNVAQSFNLNGKYGKRAFEKTRFFSRVYLRKFINLNLHLEDFEIDFFSNTSRCLHAKL